MSVGLAAGLGTLFAPAAGAAAGGGALTGLFGSILSGIGTAMFQKAQMKEEEKQKIEEERRQERRYTGAGEAVKYWDADVENEQKPELFQRARATDSRARPTGLGAAAGAQVKFDPATQKVKLA